jgi:hypothetical protein
MGRGALEVTPQVPQGQSVLAGSNIRLANGAVDVGASSTKGTYRTKVAINVGLARFVIGHTLPRGTSVREVTLDGQRVDHSTRLTNRGLEVLVRAPTTGSHELLVETR